MLPNRISAKLFVDDATTLDPAAFIPLFHSWIREARAPGIPIDVVNYSHVQDGPSVLLIGHAGDYIVDFSGGRAGLRYLHKRDWPSATLAGRLQTTLEGLLLGARLVENDFAAGAAEQPVFHSGELELTFPDRLNTPNRAQTFNAIQADVGELLASFFGVGPLQLLRATDDERVVLTIAVQAPAAHALAALQGDLTTAAPVV